jgi:hypothetical protein
MWYFLIRAAPRPGTDLAQEAGGAYINCWVNFQLEEGAEHLAKFYIEQAGWAPEETEESKWVERESYDDEPEGLQYFLEAEADGASFVFNSWDIEDQEDEGQVVN